MTFEFLSSYRNRKADTVSANASESVSFNPCTSRFGGGVTMWIAKHIHLTLFCLAPISWATAYIVQDVIRPSGIDDSFNPARFFDWAPSYFYALGFALIFLSFRSRTPLQNAIWVVMGASAYEVLQAFLPERTLDWMDLVATLSVIPFAFVIRQITKPRHGLSK